MSLAPGFGRSDCDSMPKRLIGVMRMRAAPEIRELPGRGSRRRRRRWRAAAAGLDSADGAMGKFMRRRWSMHRRLQRFRQFHQQLHACGVRAARPATITGFSAATSILAASATAPVSPCGGAVITQLRDAQLASPRSALPAARRRRRAPPAPSAASSRSCRRAPRTRRSAAATPACRPI